MDTRDLDGTVTRRIPGGHYPWETAVSPDGRNLITFAPSPDQVSGATHAHWPAARRLLTNPWHPTFWANGDSLLLWDIWYMSDEKRDSVYWLRVATLDAVVRDSIRVHGPGNGIAFAHADPRDQLDRRPVRAARSRPPNFASSTARAASTTTFHSLQWHRTTTQVTSRIGRSVPTPSGSRRVRPSANGFAIVRIPLDARSGRFGRSWDTVYTGNADISPSPSDHRRGHGGLQRGYGRAASGRDESTRPLSRASSGV